MKKGEQHTEESKAKMRKPKSSEHKKALSKAASNRSDLKTCGDRLPHNKEQCQHAQENATLSRGVHRAVEGTMLDYLRSSLVKVDENGHKYYETFIDTILKEAIEDPSGNCSKWLASGLFNENTLSKLDNTVNKMMERDLEFARYRIRNTLFDKQRELFDDRESKEIINICSRRAGKSEAVSRILSARALEPNSPCLYINLTFDNAINQCYDNVMEMLSISDCPLERASKSEGFIQLANGSSIKFRGNSNNGEADKLQGYKYRTVIIDEIQSQRNLKYLLETILTPLMKDYADSQIIYTGTPPRIPHTYCERLWNNKSIKHYHWTLLDNPYIPNKETLIDDICKQRGLTKDDPIIQREFMGIVGAYDTTAQVFKDRSYFTELPNKLIFDKAYIGIDYGGVDYNAICLCLKAGNTLYIAKEAKWNGGTVTDFVTKVQEFRAEALKYIKEERNVMVITDTNAQLISNELAITFNIPYVYYAYKYDKAEAINMLAELMRTKCIFIRKDDFIDDECSQVLYKRDPLTDAIINEIDDELYHPDIIMALLYASRQFINDGNFQIDFHNKSAREVYTN